MSTLNYAGDAVGASRQTINAIEQEKYSPSLELAFRLARAFRKEFEEVFRYVDGEVGKR